MRKEDESKVLNFFNSGDKTFTQACLDAKIKVTRRQASKWLMKRGLARKTMES